MFILVTKFQFLPFKTVLKVSDFRQLEKCNKTAHILVQNVPQPPKMFPLRACGAGAFSYVCIQGEWLAYTNLLKLSTVCCRIVSGNRRKVVSMLMIHYSRVNATWHDTWCPPVHCGALEAISRFFFSNSKKNLPVIHTHCVNIHTKFQLYSIQI